jgi:hypothetical protein
MRLEYVCLGDVAALGRVAGMTHWHKDAEAAGLPAGAGRNDQV